MDLRQLAIAAISESGNKSPRLAALLMKLAACGCGNGGGSGGGGGGNGAFPNRYDLSVNSARVEDATAAQPLLITLTGGNAAGGYNGGGTGNKAILGCKGHSGTPLSSITSIVFEWEKISLEAPLPPAPGQYYPYVNLIVDLGPTGPPGNTIRILTIDSSPLIPTLNTGTLTVIGANRWRFTHTPGANLVQVVQRNTIVAVPPPPSDFAAPPNGTGVVPIALPLVVAPNSAWPAFAFRYSDILAAYPNATLIDAGPPTFADGGLPLGGTVPSVMMIVGDSGNHSEHTEKLLSFTINGSPA